ncbi:MAG TPA: type II toxin-antitoxin system VapC family toxin [Gammaproteobacteria bacterium]
MSARGRGWLIDSDVLIDFLRGRADAAASLEGLEGRLALSAVTVAELYAGVRNGEERTTLDAFVELFEVLPVDRVVAEAGGLYRRDFGPSHGTGLGDALIAATARHHDLALVTRNRKHFPMLEQVHVPYGDA